MLRRLRPDREGRLQAERAHLRCYVGAAHPSWPDPVPMIDGDATICGVVIFKGEKV